MNEYKPEEIMTLPPWELEKLSELVAKRVQDKLIARATWVLLANGALLVGLIASGVSAYWQLDSKTEKNAALNTLQESRFALLQTEQVSLRGTLDLRFDTVNSKLDEINRFLRDHNTRVVRPPQ